MDNQNKSLEYMLIEVLRDKNLKQEEVDSLKEKLLTLETDIERYKEMYETYKEAADERLEHLMFYEKNIISKIVFKLSKVLKKKVIESSDDTTFGIKYGALYSEKEKKEFDECSIKLKGVKYKPLISLVIPVFNTDLKLLRELYLSLKEQIYDNWEVCFANGSRDNKNLNEYLKSLKEKDNRIKYKLLDRNGGISYNTNQGLKLATGEFIGMLDHDDLLTPNALAEVILALNEKPEIDFIYSDQDKVNEKTTERFGTLFKPFWSMELLYSGNYITHFSVIRKSIIDEIGGWDSNTDGAQDWDLFLKVAEKTDRIYAISKVLYHWRTAPTSTSVSMNNKNYAAQAQIRCLQNHFDRSGYKARAHFSNLKNLEIHVDWKEKGDEKISLVVWDTGFNQDINNYIWFMQLTLGSQLQEVIVASANKSRLSNLNLDCKCLYLENADYARGYNEGAELASGQIIMFVTDKAIPINTELYVELASWATNPKIGLVGPKVLNMKGDINTLGIVLNKSRPKSLFHNMRNEAGRLTAFGTTSWYRNVNGIDYQCFAIAAEKYREVGGFNKEWGYLSMFEYCLRIRKKYGYRNLVNPFAIVRYDDDFPELVIKKYNIEYLKLLTAYEMPEIDEYYNCGLPI